MYKLKERDGRAKLLFCPANKTCFFFCRSRCRRRSRCLSSLIIRKTAGILKAAYEIACENIRFSSLFVAEDASRGGSEEKRMFSQATYESVR